MKNTFYVLIAIMAMTCTDRNATQTKLLIDKNETDLINFLFEDCIGEKPGASVLVVKKGEIVHQENYGLANIENKEKITSQTNFRIASVTKSFTAMGILILIEQGKLAHKTKLAEIFPNYPEYGNDITVRHLLTHHSGVIEYDNFFDEDRTEQYSDQDVLEGLMKLDSTYFKPGTEYRYSNAGYALLAKIIEKVSNKSFADFLDDEIFQKLGMNNSTIFEISKPIKNRAYGYSAKNDSISYSDQNAVSAIQGDGGIYTSVLDYLKWDQALYTDKLISQNKIKDAFYDRDGDIKTDNDGYGYGWSISYRDGIKLVHHSGGTTGFSSYVMRVPSLKLSAIVFSNKDGYDREMLHRVNTLISIYSDYKIALPIEIPMKKEIEYNGIENGIQIFDTLKNDKKYLIDNTTLPYLGMEYYRSKQFLKAERIFMKATEEYPNHFGGYWGLGLLNKKKGNYEEAIKYLKKVIELGTEPEDFVAIRAKEYVEELLTAKSQ